MGTLFLFLLMTVSFCCYGQTGCKPTANAKVVFCSGPPLKDSIIRSCMDREAGLVSLDSNYTILSFTFIASGEGFDDVVEIAVKGALFSGQVKRVMERIRSGSSISVECIRARHKNGFTNTLQPIFIEVK